MDGFGWTSTDRGMVGSSGSEIGESDLAERTRIPECLDHTRKALQCRLAQVAEGPRLEQAEMPEMGRQAWLQGPQQAMAPDTQEEAETMGRVHRPVVQCGTDPQVEQVTARGNLEGEEKCLARGDPARMWLITCFRKRKHGCDVITPI